MRGKALWVRGEYLSQAGLAIATAGPMFKILAERAVSSSASLIYRASAELSAILSRRSVTLFLKRVLFRGTLVLGAVTMVIAIFEDDALEKWSKRTLYRGPKFANEKLFESLEKELGALYGAVREVL